VKIINHLIYKLLFKLEFFKLKLFPKNPLLEIKNKFILKKEKLYKNIKRGILYVGVYSIAG